MQHVERSLNADGRVVGVGCPKFVVPGQLMSAGVNELQLLLTVFYGSVFAGLYSLAQWTTIALMGLFANAIGDVYGREAAEQYAGKGECIDMFIASFRQLLVFAFLPMIAVFMLGPSILALCSERIGVGQVQLHRSWCSLCCIISFGFRLQRDRMLFESGRRWLC
ncbi:hypothetical protein I5P84_10215 [Pseudomonas mosselii]|uniref:hypothetical protein n=1 Tax=Pseudomonas mosselii TaxID=78327 RepID=UPI0018D7DF46|nr:hypothetical protein [Pseudomonas mosselii]MBH3309814.1 hypothetical protein [Pseudomonas mosselii]MBH3325867.1 hypothetical protein [Pseudomonas mosselii]